jgi:hypothetical protein
MLLASTTTGKVINPSSVRQNGEQIVDQTHNKFCAVDEI